MKTQASPIPALTSKVVFFALLAVGATLSGCVATQADSARDRLIQRGYSAAYADGFAHGIQSGKSAAGHPYASLQKDPKRYREEDDYKQGYDDGFAQGKGEYEGIRRASNSL
jgi:hypothetical protein